MQLKATPEDFVVEERLSPRFDDHGPYALYLLKKREWNTEDCVQWLAHALHKQRKELGVCGNKDKHAVTTQYLTIKNGPKDIRTPLDTETQNGFTLTYQGQVAEPLYLGAHTANAFTITVRDLPSTLNGTTPTLKPIKNFFGEQRFSTNNSEIGMLLITKQNKLAAEALGLTFTTDPISAIRAMPKHTLLLYVHAAQSTLWNELAVNIAPPLDGSNPIIPMPGYGPEGDPTYLPLLDALLEKHGLDRMSFVNKAMPEISVEGNARPLLQDVQDFSATRIENGVCTVRFTLGTGQYATETLRQLFEN